MQSYHISLVDKMEVILLKIEARPARDRQAFELTYEEKACALISKSDTVDDVCARTGCGPYTARMMVQGYLNRLEEE